MKLTQENLRRVIDEIVQQSNSSTEIARNILLDKILDILEKEIETQLDSPDDVQ